MCKIIKQKEQAQVREIEFVSYIHLRLLQLFTFGLTIRPPVSSNLLEVYRPRLLASEYGLRGYIFQHSATKVQVQSRSADG